MKTYLPPFALLFLSVCALPLLLLSLWRDLGLQHTQLSLLRAERLQAELTRESLRREANFVSAVGHRIEPEIELPPPGSPLRGSYEEVKGLFLEFLLHREAGKLSRLHISSPRRGEVKVEWTFLSPPQSTP